MTSVHLPHQRHARPELEDGPRRMYHFTTSDALQRPKVVSLTDEANRAVWTMTRGLTEEELVDTVSDASGRARWTIHRPRQGWYLVLRSPQLPSGSFVALQPAKGKRSPTFAFSVRSYVDALPSSPSDEPRGVRLDMDSTSRHADPEQEKDVSGTQLKNTSTLCRFRLELGVPKHTHRMSSRPFSVSSFTGLFAGRGNTWNCVWEDREDVEVMRFEEATSVLGTATKGNLILNVHVIDVLGLEPSFWAAVALAYTEFLEDRDAYEAALHDA